MRASLATLLVSGLLLAGCSSPPSGEPSDGDGSGPGGAPNGTPPQLHVGDFWSHESSGGGATVKTRVQVLAVEEHAGASAYRLGGSVETDAGGANTTAESTSWTRASDHATMESHSTAHVSFGGQSYDSTTTTVYDPPCVTLRWGLSVGDSWTSTCTTKTTSSSGGEQTATKSTIYTVEARESVTVRAGTFDAYRLRTDSGGQSQTQWVSEEACGLVKSEATAQGQAVVTELVDYGC